VEDPGLQRAFKGIVKEAMGVQAKLYPQFLVNKKKKKGRGEVKGFGEHEYITGGKKIRKRWRTARP